MQVSTFFLRATVVILGFIAVGLAILILPAIYSEWEHAYPQAACLKYPALVILSMTMIPFFIALHQTLKLLRLVDKNEAFSEVSVAALKKIKYCALGFGGLYALFLPIAHVVARGEDAPGLMIIGLIMTCAPVVIAVFAAVLQRLLQSAITIKSENDLTV